MNEQLAKEARRNLRKEMGATATDAMERARHEVLRLQTQHAVIAREFADYKRNAETAHEYFRAAIVRLDARIDGTGAWCEQNERLLDAWREMSTHFAERMNSVIHGGFWTRVRWMLVGTVPGQWRSPFGTESAPQMTQGGARVPESQVVVE